MSDAALDYRLFLRQPWNAHQQRHLRRLLIERPLFEHSVVAHHVAVLAREHDYSVVGDACILQSVRNLADHVVNERDVSQIVCAQRAPALFGSDVFARSCVASHVVIVRVAFAFEHELHEIFGAHAIDAGCTLRHFEESVAHRNLGGVVHIHVWPVIWRVRLEGADIENERIVLVFFDELCRAVTQVVCHRVLFA